MKTIQVTNGPKSYPVGIRCNGKLEDWMVKSVRKNPPEQIAGKLAIVEFERETKAKRKPAPTILNHPRIVPVRAVEVDYSNVERDSAEYHARYNKAPEITPEERRRAQELGITTVVYMKEKANGGRLDSRGLLCNVDHRKTTAYHNANFKSPVRGEVDYNF